MSEEREFGNGRVAAWVDQDVAFVEIRNPPVNAGSHDVRRGLLDALSQLEDRTDLAGVVLCGAGGTFIAGSDLREFGAPLGPPQLPQVIAAVETLALPVVAAMDGAALGGGYELALGCDARVAAPNAVVGLPEVGLGLVPGAGGTQRLPRLTGLAEAMRLICGARRVKARDALALGMIDVVAEGDLRTAAAERARTMDGKARVGDRACPSATADELDGARTEALRAGKDRPAAHEAIRLIALAADMPIKEALAEERRVFQEIRVGPEARALRHIFFAERAAGRVDGLGASPRDLARAAVVGVGTMGAGIAYALLKAGLEVALIERDAAMADAGRARVEGLIEADRDVGRASSQAADGYRAALDHGTALNLAADCDLVVEAIVEDMGAKSELLAELDGVVRSDCVLASNTSYLDLDELARASVHPGRVVGLHFFNPAHVMKLLEVVRGAATSDVTLATALKLGRRMRKTAIVAGVGEGFVGNRIYAAYRAQAEMLVEDGALPWQVDAALQAFGLAMGPFAVGDLSGLDIAQAMRRRRDATRDPRERYVKLPDLLCEAGRLGRKTGAGWYDYEDGRRQESADVQRIIDEDARAAGRTRRDVSSDEIEARALGALVNEAACVLEDGVAQRASDIDVAFVNGYGFPRWRGGPLWWASVQDRDAIARAIDAVAQAVGPTFRRGPVERVLDELA